MIFRADFDFTCFFYLLITNPFLDSSICGFTLWMFFTMFALTLNFCNALIMIFGSLRFFCCVLFVITVSKKVCISLQCPVCEPLRCTNKPLWQEETQLQSTSECFKMFVVLQQQFEPENHELVSSVPIWIHHSWLIVEILCSLDSLMNNNVI